MSKKTNSAEKAAAGIEAGKPMTVTAATRAELSARLRELREQAAAEGLNRTTGGFIGFNPGIPGDQFSAVITFN